MTDINAKIRTYGLQISDGYSQSLELWLELELQGGGRVAFSVWGPYTEGWKNNVFAYSVKKVLDIVGVEKLKDIDGKPIRARFKENGCAGDTIIGIGHFLNDNWFIPREEPLYQTF